MKLYRKDRICGCQVYVMGDRQDLIGGCWAHVILRVINGKSKPLARTAWAEGE